MLKKRIIPILSFIDNRLVKSIKFNKLINVGEPIKAAKIFNDSDADEIILLNINRNNRCVAETSRLLDKLSRNCFMPISVGGGIKNFNDAKLLFDAGADKVVINTKAYTNSSLIKSISEKYGPQSIVLSIDVRLQNNEYKLYSDCGNNLELTSLETHILKMENIKIGEVLINSIDRDGTMKGYDNTLLKLVSKISSRPIIACGGAGNFNHLKIAFLKNNISAVACGSLFNFGDNNPIRAKNYLINYNLDFKMIDQ